MKKILIILAVITASLVVITLIPREKEETEEITVVATLFPFYDMAKEIGKEKAEVSLLLPPGIEPHSFEPKTGDFITINNTDIFIYTGKFMEPWAEEIIKSVEGPIVIEASSGIDLLEEDDHGDEVDPHIWLDLENVKKIADSIAKAMIDASPENRDFFIENLNNYIDKLDRLDISFRESLENCKRQEIIYTGHYAFGYLSRRYNLEHTALQGLSPDAEPTISSLISAIERIKEEEIRYIFYEELASPRIAEIIREETGAEMLSLNPGENLKREEFEQGVSFFNIMEKNLENLKIGLECL